MTVPANPEIYHITHYENLKSIFDHGSIVSDAECLSSEMDHTKIGMNEIKRRRLEDIKVICNRGTMVGEYVPFYFCPRSIMLYIFYMNNHPDLAYRDGQEPIAHIQADLHKVVKWANSNSVPWAFSDGNAGTFYTNFYNDIDDLDVIDWDAVSSTDFRDINIKEKKQAEFLLYRSFPIELIESIGVIDRKIKKKVDDIINSLNIKLPVFIKPDWYF